VADVIYHKTQFELPESSICLPKAREKFDCLSTQTGELAKKLLDSQHDVDQLSVEAHSIDATIMIYDPDYLSWIRYFPRYAQEKLLYSLWRCTVYKGFLQR